MGFRPFVFRLASELGLTGWVGNNAAGVIIEAQSTGERLAHFLRRLTTDAPPLALVDAMEHHPLPDRDDETTFEIRESSAAGERTARIPPDSALCPDCLAELFDPADRRYRYPLITCTNCGPRYSIITALPYDRPATTMAPFPLCPACSGEYHDPADRRFHAQPLACPECGPHVGLLDMAGNRLSDQDDAVRQSVRLLHKGAILAVKGIGGYHLAVDAENPAAVRRLRQRKKRDEKPFAVMVPDLAAARRLALLTPMEERLLAAPEAPIVIVRTRRESPLAEQIAPGNGWLGLLLPYTPLQHLLFAPETGSRDPHVPFRALVMTSANCSDSPVIHRDDDALRELAGIADYLLLHNRQIHIREDDSVMRVFQGQPLFYRRARGYVPRPIRLPFTTAPLLAAGAELKGAICLAQGEQAVLSQHIGDLQHDTVYDTLRHTVEHLSGLLNIVPEAVACDLHPDFHSTLFAREYADRAGLPVHPVQHHHAHLAACMAENRLQGEVIGLIFDGTGLGTDGTVWGGELLCGGYAGFERRAHIRQVRLPGGDAAVREPWRMALAWLYQSLGPAALESDTPSAGCLPQGERTIFRTMLERGLNAPLTSSCGRLFDAAAALLGLRQTVSYDGQAAIELEALAETADPADTELLPFQLHTDGSGMLQLDVAPFFPALLAGLAAGQERSVLAARFHRSVARAACEACLLVSRETGLERVVLSGGVFQNRLLSEMVYSELNHRGLQVYCHRLSPPNDGCIALGQAAVAGWKTRR